MMRDYDAHNIHREMTVCDTHCDTISRVLDEGVDLGVRSDEGHIDIPRLKEGGVDVQLFACWGGRSGKPAGHYVKRVLRMIDALHLQLYKNSDAISLALTAGDIQEAEQHDKIAVIIGIEGGHAIEDDLGFLRNFHRLGVRCMTLTWNSTNWADASREESQHDGLSDFGRDVVREMNRLGMMVDVSHSADKTVWDTLEISVAPIIASHSCAKAICDHPRNLNDDLIRAIANAGGVICVNFCPFFLDQEFENQSREGIKPTPPPLSKVIDHIDYIADVGGIDSVGIGSDFDGLNPPSVRLEDAIPPPVGLEDASGMPRITEALLAKGYSAQDCAKIMGGNFLRVFGQACGI